MNLIANETQKFISKVSSVLHGFPKYCQRSACEIVRNNIDSHRSCTHPWTRHFEYFFYLTFVSIATTTSVIVYRGGDVRRTRWCPSSTVKKSCYAIEWSVPDATLIVRGSVQNNLNFKSKLAHV